MVSPLGRLFRLPTSSNWNPVQQCGAARRRSLWEVISPGPLWWDHCLGKRHTPVSPTCLSTVRVHCWNTWLKPAGIPRPTLRLQEPWSWQPTTMRSEVCVWTPVMGGLLSEPPEWDGFQRWEQYRPLWGASAASCLPGFLWGQSRWPLPYWSRRASWGQMVKGHMQMWGWMAHRKGEGFPQV